MQWYQDLKILKSSKSNVISCQDLEGQLKAARSALEAEREKRDFEYEIRMKLRDESDAKSVKIKGLQKDLQKLGSELILKEQQLQSALNLAHSSQSH